MLHQICQDDRVFRTQVETFTLPLDEFNHEAHVRLAYIYLATSGSTDAAIDCMRKTLLGLLGHAGIDPSVKYHETLTQAWMRAVAHFMSRTRAADSAADFLDQNPQLRDAGIMQSHYSPSLLFSEEARAEFVEPDRSEIPRDGAFGE